MSQRGDGGGAAQAACHEHVGVELVGFIQSESQRDDLWLCLTTTTAATAAAGKSTAETTSQAARGAKSRLDI